MGKIVKIIKLSDIDSFNNHPFKVEADESIGELVESIRQNGLLTPLVVRKKNNKYEMISGHRRKLALELNGILEAECEVKNLDDYEAIIQMVDSNLYREKILPSEKAFAYKMKLDAIKHQGKKETSTRIMQKRLSAEEVGKVFGDSREKVRKYIRLTLLEPTIKFSR